MDEPERRREPRSRRPDFAPLIILVILLGLIAAGFFAFPAFEGMMKYQDCVASGRVDCARR